MKTDHSKITEKMKIKINQKLKWLKKLKIEKIKNKNEKKKHENRITLKLMKKMKMKLKKKIKKMKNENKKITIIKNHSTIIINKKRAYQDPLVEEGRNWEKRQPVSVDKEQKYVKGAFSGCEVRFPGSE